MQRHSNERGAFRSVPRTGVIFVTTEAAKLGFSAGAKDWCNLGQGQPETGALPDAPPRITTVDVPNDTLEYAPVAGLWELREAVAKLYNRLYREGKSSQYTGENVAICGGGRLSLTRAAASLGAINLGHFLPDYTAYEELLDIFKTFTPIPILRSKAAGLPFGEDALREEVLGRGLGAVLLSNPCNPTGELLAGDTLRKWVSTCRELDCALLVDEFYSQYVWGKLPGKAIRAVSAAEWVEHVDEDPVLIFDGLTKNWRYPGWRITWMVGPKSTIDAAASAGSFLDGGASHPLQRAAVDIVNEDHVRRENKALHQVFAAKRTTMVEGLRRLGIQVDDPDGSFYAWGDVSALPGELSDGMAFFRRALEHKVIVVPGEFFDVNPGQRRSGRVSRFRSYVRFSFGPELATIEQGLARLELMLRGGN